MQGKREFECGAYCLYVSILTLPFNAADADLFVHITDGLWNIRARLHPGNKLSENATLCGHYPCRSNVLYHLWEVDKYIASFDPRSFDIMLSCHRFHVEPISSFQRVSKLTVLTSALSVSKLRLRQSISECRWCSQQRRLSSLTTHLWSTHKDPEPMRKSGWFITWDGPVTSSSSVSRCSKITCSFV